MQCHPNLMIEEDATAWLQLVLIHKAQDGNVVLAPHAGGPVGSHSHLNLAQHVESVNLVQQLHKPPLKFFVS